MPDTMPRLGEVVHLVEHSGLRCRLTIVVGAVHPLAGDDSQWCLVLEDALGTTYRHRHVPHGFETGHWHTRQECTP